jgi:hypothetical protein
MSDDDLQEPIRFSLVSDTVVLIRSSHHHNFSFNFSIIKSSTSSSNMGFLARFCLPSDPPAHKSDKQADNFFYRLCGLPSGIERCVSSPYIRPVYLGLLRLLLGVNMLISFIVYFSILASQPNKFLRKQAWKLLGDLMMHSYLGLAGYFLFSAYHTLTYAFKKKNPLSKWPNSLRSAHLVLQSSILTFPLFCTVIYMYWTLPALPAWHTRTLTLWSTITFYMLNTVFSLTELFLSASRPRPWSHLIFVVVFLGLYLAFHTLLVAASSGKVWVYTVLKFSLSINRGGISALRVSGLCILAVVSFCLMQLLLWIKCRYLGGLKLPSKEREATRPHCGHADVLDETSC